MTRRGAYVGHVDYTDLRYRTDAAIHSGDLTSAPAPLGATEYIDLRPADLTTSGARWAIPIVFSYNDVPFELLEDAFAGFAAPTRADAQFDAGRVAQRFDLRGHAKVLAPMVVDLETREMLWIDANLSASGYGHNVNRYRGPLGHLGSDLWDHFANRRRPTILDIVAWHACTRADHVDVVHTDGSATRITSADPSTMLAAVRHAAEEHHGPGTPSDVAGERVLLAVADGSNAANVIPIDQVSEGSVAVTASGRPPEQLLHITVGDLLAGLVPTSGS